MRPGQLPPHPVAVMYFQSKKGWVGEVGGLQEDSPGNLKSEVGGSAGLSLLEMMLSFMAGLGGRLPNNYLT